MSSYQSPRQTAVFLLDQVLGERRLMAELLTSNAIEALQPASRARAQRLATETLRGLERIDRLLSRHLRKKNNTQGTQHLTLGNTRTVQRWRCAWHCQ